MEMEGYRDENSTPLDVVQTKRSSRCSKQAVGFEMLFQESKSLSDASTRSAEAVESSVSAYHA
jgi:hypothetical protein